MYYLGTSTFGHTPPSRTLMTFEITSTFCLTFFNHTSTFLPQHIRPHSCHNTTSFCLTLFNVLFGDVLLCFYALSGTFEIISAFWENVEIWNTVRLFGAFWYFLFISFGTFEMMLSQKSQKKVHVISKILWDNLKNTLRLKVHVISKILWDNVDF